jgi:two-component system, NarL family, sensor histidine kinase UhpB
MNRFQIKRSEDSLIGQLTAANVLLVMLTLLAASLATFFDLNVAAQRVQFAIVALLMVLTLCVNLWMLQRRFAPLEDLIRQVEGIDPAQPARFDPGPEPAEEIGRLARSFKRLLDRVEHERRRSGGQVLRAQENERRRLASDLHDEVNQALTAILLRLEALGHDVPDEMAGQVAELKRLVNQAMEELLSLARQLRPAALDDHGLVPAIEAQLSHFAERTGTEVRLEAQGEVEGLNEDEQTAIYRIVQEALTNIGRHAEASLVEVELARGGYGTLLRIRDDGKGFDPGSSKNGGLGLEGMAERARVVGGELDLRSAPGAGTSLTVRLT